MVMDNNEAQNGPRENAYPGSLYFDVITGLPFQVLPLGRFSRSFDRQGGEIISCSLGMFI